MDPFTGSGGVNAVCCQVNRPSIGIDISPASTFIAKHLCSPQNIEEITDLYQTMCDALRPVREFLYERDAIGVMDELKFSTWYGAKPINVLSVLR